MLRPKRSIRVFAPFMGFQDNMGALFRLCDAMGVEEVIFGHDIDLNSRRLRKAARSSITALKTRVSPDHKFEIESFRKNGGQIIGLELTDTSFPLQDCALDIDTDILLVIGHEVDGIPKEILQILPQCYHINMYGQNSSMNVVHATAMALYHFRSLE
ncbi:TrmH family RNA methyltransferase [Sediminicola luteus]|nr:TrmH family RNA methyltransferase [Sediminicola luteus]